MGVQLEHWQALPGHPQASDGSKLLQYGLLFAKLTQTMFAAAATWTFGRGVFEVSSAIVVCAGDCVMAEDFTKSADSLLTGFLVLNIAAFVTAVVVLGVSIYRLAKPLPGVAALEETNCSRTVCACPAGPIAEYDVLICFVLLFLLELVRCKVLPSTDIWQSVLGVGMLCALNVLALHAIFRIEQIGCAASLEEEEEQFLMSDSV